MALASATCTGSQSALEPAGRGAEVIARLFWWMAGGAFVIWLAVFAVTLHAMRVRARPHSIREATTLIVIGGAVVPTIVLAGLLAYGLSLMPDLLAPAPPGSLRIAVSGEQWWWRVRYLPPQGEPIDLANEIRLPLGEPVDFELSSADVIHSFWIPSLGGKMDMIPGRRTRLTLWPTATGRYEGVCAEFCGSSHAFMKFPVVVMEKEEFALWLRHQAEPARVPVDALSVRGKDRFAAAGCGACHTVRGTSARGVLGPDLTHIGTRLTLAAGILPNGPGMVARWLESSTAIKPDVHMPAFGMLPSDDLRAIAAYLEALQ